jgi:hypothetical protein
MEYEVKTAVDGFAGMETSLVRLNLKLRPFFINMSILLLFGGTTILDP